MRVERKKSVSIESDIIGGDVTVDNATDTIQAIQKLVDGYFKYLRMRFFYPGRADGDKLAPKPKEQISHIMWMAQEMQKCVVSTSADELRLNRWLGFMQGVMWSLKIVTIDRLRDETKLVGKLQLDKK